MYNKLIPFILKLREKYQTLCDRCKWDMSDIYLVSYPKSGATWVCLLIANVIKQLNNDPRRIDFFSVHDYVPDIHANPHRISQIQPPRFIKTHESFSQWYRRIYIKGRGVQFPRVIYLIRNGCDTVASAYSYSKAMTGHSDNFSEFIINDRKIRGTWTEHVNAWILNNKILDKKEILLVRYENLLNDPINEIQKIMDFAGIYTSSSTLKNAVYESDLKNIRMLESKFGGGVKYKNPEYKFARTGKKNRFFLGHY